VAIATIDFALRSKINAASNFKCKQVRKNLLADGARTFVAARAGEGKAELRQ